MATGNKDKTNNKRSSSSASSASSSDDHDDDPNQLVTPASLALSLAPPRAPPHYTPHRLLLAALDPTSAARLRDTTDATDDDDDPRTVHPHSFYTHHDLRSRLAALLPTKGGPKGGRVSLHLPHPHLPAIPELGDRITRALGSTLTLTRQNTIRDDGHFRSIVDSLVTATVPALAVSNPSAVRSFVGLTRGMSVVRYGRHDMQKVELFVPQKADRTSRRHRGLVFFVHGGAWGSGMPWMYRLIATAFLEVGLAVAVVGYRTYPDADVAGQVDDLERAAEALGRERPDLFRRPDDDDEEEDWLGVHLMGHSSGAHIALLMLVDRVGREMDRALAEAAAAAAAAAAAGDDATPVTSGSRDGSTNNSSSPGSFAFASFVGLSGPYSISDHFDYEAGRGVEELSPMKPACGHTRDAFRHYSPALRLTSMLANHATTNYATTNGTQADQGYGETDLNGFLCLDNYLPPCLFVHGVEDATVPFTATSDCAALLRRCGSTKCREAYLSGGAGHEDTVMELMLGGTAGDLVVGWVVEDHKRCKIGASGGGGGGSGRGRGLIKRSNL